MKEKLNTHYKTLQPSFIREILKVTKEKEIISFAGGLPDESLFPKKEFQKILEQLSTNLTHQDLQYANTEGEKKLQSLLFKKQILITDGSQQGLDLIAKVFINKGDKILIESPSYLGATEPFKTYGAELESINLEKDGLDLRELEKKLQESSYKFLYIIPDFQNPTGINYTIKKRKELANLAKKYNLLIIEDAPYRDLYFEKPFPTISSFAPKQVITLRSFSKVLAPALRLGWIEAEKEVLEKLTIAKQYSVLHTNTFSQKIAIEYLKSYSLQKHLKTIRKSYEEKAMYMYECLLNEFGSDIEIEKPKGGMFLWCEFKKEFDTERLFNIAIEKGVAFVPSFCFYEERVFNKARLNFTNSSKEEIKRGVKILRKSYKLLMND